MNDHKDINKYLKEKRKREIKEVAARAVLFILATVILVGLRLAYKVVEFRIFRGMLELSQVINMSDNRTINEEYAAIGAELIENEPELAYIRDIDARIIYLSSDCRKRDGMKVIFGQCEKIADKYKWGLPCDFTVTIFEPNVAEFSEEQMRILIFHELLHVGTDGKSVRPHDLEDFKVIINRFGTEWNVV